MSFDSWAENERFIKSNGGRADALLELTSAGKIWVQFLQKFLTSPATSLPRAAERRWVCEVPLSEGGLHSGEVFEISDCCPPGSGKVEFAWFVAASCAASGRTVVYIQGASRWSDSQALRHSRPLAPRGLRMVFSDDLDTLSRLLASFADPCATVPTLLVVDGLAELLAPLQMGAGGRGTAAARWRLAWASRALRRFARDTCVAVLVLSCGRAILGG